MPPSPVREKPCQRREDEEERALHPLQFPVARPRLHTLARGVSLSVPAAARSDHTYRLTAAAQSHPLL